MNGGPWAADPNGWVKALDAYRREHGDPPPETNAWPIYWRYRDQPSREALGGRLRNLSERLEAAQSRHGMARAMG